MKPVFNQQIISELRARVIEHNEQVGDSAPVRLGQIKGLYKRYYNGSDPHHHALTKLDDHLAGLRKQRRGFDSGKHPRAGDGQFRPIGGQAGRHRDVTTRQQHNDLADSNAGYTAATTQVIPETRYSVFGPPIAGAAGIALGAAGGATATLRGSPIDRGVTAYLRRVGRGVGGGITTTSYIAAHRLSRDGLTATNRVLGTNLPHPGPSGTPAWHARVAMARRLGERPGALLGTVAGRAAALTSFPAGAARTTTTRLAGGGLRGKIVGGIAGGIIGSAMPGYFYARGLAGVQSFIGPYEDALFPRRVGKLPPDRVRRAAGAVGDIAFRRNVEKFAGSLFDDPAVLAKQAELLADEELAKVSIGGVVRGVSALLRRPTVGGAATGGLGPDLSPAARAAFEQHAPRFQVGRKLQGRSLKVGQHVGTLAIGGAGLGALTGTALGAFNEKHPRGQGGRFSTKHKGVFSGATVGAAVGAGLGIATGLVAARQGHTALLTQALARLRGQAAVDINGTPTNLAEAMRTETQAHAELAHAERYRAQHPRQVEPAPPGANAHQHILGTLRQKAIDTFMREEGTAMQGGARAWYRWQLDRSFDVAARRQLSRLGPVLSHDGSPATHGLIDTVDPERLSADQRKVWDNLVERHRNTVGEIDKIYEGRAEATTQVNTELAALRTERTQLDRAIPVALDQWDSIGENATLAQMRTFARERLRHTLQATTRAEAKTEIENRLPVFETENRARIAQIEERIPEMEPFVEAARNHQTADLSEQELRAVQNPFATSRAGRFFRNRPEGADTREGFNRIREAIGERAAKPFVDSAQAYIASAHGHLDTLIAAQEAALQARIPSASRLKQVFDKVAPKLTSRLQSALSEYQEITTGRREELPEGFQKRITTWLEQHKRPMQAWQAAKDISGGARDYAKKGGYFALEHWKAITSTVGFLSAMGAIDLNAGPWGDKFKLDHKRWRKPRELGYELFRPDPINRPDEAVMGLSFRGPTGQRQFLQGLYVKPATAGSTRPVVQDIPFGSDVDQIRNTVRGRGATGGGGRAEAVPVQNSAQVHNTIATLRRDGHIVPIGPEGFQFDQRESGDPGNAQEQVRNGFYEKFIRHWEGFGYQPNNPRRMGASSRQPGPYFTALKSLFDSPEAPALDQASRVGLLIGTANRRGIFANHGGVFRSPPANANKPAVIAELKRQVVEQGANVSVPINDDQYIQLRRALWLVGRHYDLNDDQQAEVVAALDHHWTRRNNRPPPAGVTSSQGTGRDQFSLPETSNFDEFFAHVRDTTPAELRPELMRNDELLRDSLRSQYQNHLRLLNRDHPQMLQVEKHRRAATETWNWLNDNLERSEPDGGLRKFLARPDQAPQKPQAPKPPMIAGSAMPKGPSLGHQVKTAAKPANALGQLGTYGLSQAGYEAATGLARYALPGGGLAARAARIGAGTIAGFGGAVYGLKAGHAAGHALGDHSKAPEQSPGEAISRGLAGTAGQIGASAASHGIIQRAVAPAAGRAIGAGIGRVLGGTIGTALEPGGGTVAGIAIGTAIGAGAGYLADEGMGILFHHLSRYGNHVPHVAAKALGHSTMPAHALVNRPIAGSART